MFHWDIIVFYCQFKPSVEWNVQVGGDGEIENYNVE